MNGSPTTDSLPATPSNGPRGRRRTVFRRRLAPLGAKDRARHAMLIADGVPKSGRCGAYVYYMFKGRLCWRRYVVPSDPRTTAQQSLQVLQSQRVTRPSSERPQTNTVALPVGCRWEAGYTWRIGRIGPLRCSSTRGKLRRNTHWREMWRGG